VLYPGKRSYRRFLDHLLQLYEEAKRAAADGRLREQGRKERVATFEERLAGLCLQFQSDPTAWSGTSQGCKLLCWLSGLSDQLPESNSNWRQWG
jgi:hypothetical protein